MSVTPGRAAAGLLLLALLTVLFSLAPEGGNWREQIYPPVRDHWTGAHRLYDLDPNAWFFPQPPVAVLVFTPFVALGERWGEALFRAVGLLVVVAGAAAFTPAVLGWRRPVIIALAVANLWTLWMVWWTNPTWLTLLGVLLAVAAQRRRDPLLWACAGVLFLIKPQQALLPGAVALAGLAWWPRPRAAAALALAGGLGIGGCFLAGGWDWPGRWLAYLGQDLLRHNYVATTWRAGNEVGLPLLGLVAAVAAAGVVGWMLLLRLRSGSEPDRDLWALAVAANALVAPYSLSLDFVVLTALAWTRVAGRAPVLGAGTYLLTLMPLIRLPLGPNAFWIDVVYPVAVCAAALALRIGVPGTRRAGEE